MQTTIDTAITYRILRLLTTPWTKQKAYALAIIDERGNPLRKYAELTTQEERNAYTILVRLVFRLKRIIEKVPVGNKQFLSYAAALALLKESHDLDHEPLDYELMFFEVCEMDDLPTRLVEEFLNTGEPTQTVTFSQFREDVGVGAVAANSTANVVATGDDNKTVVPKKKTKIQKRSNP